MSTIELNIDYMQVDSIVMKRTESIVRSVLKNQGFNAIELNKSVEAYFDYKQEKTKALEFENRQLKSQIKACLNELLELKLMLDLGIPKENHQLLKRVLNVQQLWKEYGYPEE